MDSPPPTDPRRLRAALAKARAVLLAERAPDGHWVGELSSSALSTATAVTALAIGQRENHGTAFDAAITRGLDWLAAHANADGGWGDTTRSFSNLSTTTLGWAAFGVVPGAEHRHALAVPRAARWIEQHAGGLAPDVLGPAVIARYGRDRTFSVPILTMCALAGRLGHGRDAWRHVIPLPFELAVFPHSWFAALRLPVVSYALPALIAIGQARHRHRPSRNPLARLARNLATGRTLRVLTNIQPGNGGFLEATPLTSFVVMSLAGSGRVEHEVTRRGIDFLLASQRPDGSWPIDTNLSTWLTTLAVNALGADVLRTEPAPVPSPSTLDQSALRAWLLAQQYRTKHAYTHAAPGGWAWTNLPGGVPDADDTAGALLAIRRLGPPDDTTRAAALAGLRWLLDLQNRDGGVPTFCRGWGALPFDRSSADLTAHALRAWLAWLPETPPALATRLRRAMRAALNFLARAAHPDGSWAPLWFGNQFAPDETNPTYGTARVLVALGEMAGHPDQPLSAEAARLGATARRWLLRVQNLDGGWGGQAGTPSSVEETALTVEALAGAHLEEDAAVRTARDRGVAWLLERVESGAWTEPAPIGFYFARLWYYEKLYPLIFTVGALAAADRRATARP